MGTAAAAGRAAAAGTEAAVRRAAAARREAAAGWTPSSRCSRHLLKNPLCRYRSECRAIKCLFIGLRRPPRGAAFFLLPLQKERKCVICPFWRNRRHADGSHLDGPVDNDESHCRAAPDCVDLGLRRDELRRSHDFLSTSYKSCPFPSAQAVTVDSEPSLPQCQK